MRKAISLATMLVSAVVLAPVAPARALSPTLRPCMEVLSAAGGDRVFFDRGRHAIPSDSEAAARNLALCLLQDPRLRIVIEGHADQRGTREFNLALGERRAEALRRFLVGQGVAGERIRVISYGEERPACFESTRDCRQLNRKAVIVLDAGSAS